MFAKNLECIKNEALKRRLEKISTLNSKEGITYYVTQSNDYILLKNDVPIDDLYNPREAIVKHFNENIKKEMLPNDIIAPGTEKYILPDPSDPRINPEIEKLFPVRAFMKAEAKLARSMIAVKEALQNAAASRIVSNGLYHV